MTKLTKAQRKTLAQAVADGGEICLTGADQTEPCPRRDVVERLASLGYLRLEAPPTLHMGLRDYFRITEAGRQWLRGIK